MASLWGEIKRRKVVQVAAVYAVVTWLLVQIVATVEAPLNLPEWFDTAVIVLLAVGFPIAVILAWAFDLTPAGLVSDRGGSESLPRRNNKLEITLVTLLVIAVIWIGYREIFARPLPEPDRLPNSVAVLPCANFSADPANEFFAPSLHEEILNQLFKLSNLSVIARTSVLQYENAALPVPRIAEELNVSSVMECSVAYADGRVVISTQLIDGQTGLHLWSDRYNEEFIDVFAIQADIAMNVANALAVEFSGEEQAAIAARLTESEGAYEAYLRSQSVGPGQSQQVLAHLNEAIRLDPGFALAHARKALWYANNLISQFGADAAEPTEWAQLERLVRESAGAALEADPDAWQAHEALGLVHERFWRWTEAEQEFVQAARTMPATVEEQSPIYDAGDWPEKIRRQRQVVLLNPNSGVQHWILGLYHAYAGNAAAAATAFRAAINLDAGRSLWHLWLAHAEGALGNDETALNELSVAEELPGVYQSTLTLANLAYAYGQIDRADDAKRLFDLLADRDPDQRHHAGTWALAHLAVRDYESARDSLETVVDKIGNEEPDAGHIALRLIRWNVYSDPVLDQFPFSELRTQIRGH